MLRFKNIFKITFLLFFLSPVNLVAQEWSDPIQVSNIEGYPIHPDMCIDNNGIIHAVWSQKLDDNFWKIMYSKSQDNGNTWSYDQDVSDNDYLWMSQPSIAADSENKLYVTYDYNTMQPANMHVLMKIKEGNFWSDTILITEGMPGSDYNKLIIDHNDNLIIGWYRNAKYYYKFFTDGVLSESYCPFCDSVDTFLPNEFELCSSSNVIKWVGGSESINYLAWRVQYFEHNLETNTWSKPVIVDTNQFVVGQDIALTQNDKPVVAYQIKTSVWPNPFSDATFYNTFDNQTWAEPELVVEDPENQQIVIDQNNLPHIVQREKTPNGYQIVHYQKVENEWLGFIVDSGYIVQMPKLEFYNNQLFMVYSKTWDLGDDFISEIMFTKFDVITNINKIESPFNKLKLYPNPAKDYVNIEFNLSQRKNVKVIISEFNGKHVKTLVDNIMPIGKQSINWDCKNKNGVKVSSGLYLCRVYAGRNVMTKSIQVIK